MSRVAQPTRHHEHAYTLPTLTRGFQTATDTPVILEEGAPVVPPPGRVGAVGIGNGPAILSKFIVSSFKMSVFDKARLFSRVTKQHEKQTSRSVQLGLDIMLVEGGKSTSNFSPLVCFTYVVSNGLWTANVWS